VLRSAQELKNICNIFISRVSGLLVGGLEEGKEEVKGCLERVEEKKRDVVEKMAVYLDEETMVILFNPIKRKSIKIVEDVQKRKGGEDVCVDDFERLLQKLCE